MSTQQLLAIVLAASFSFATRAQTNDADYTWLTTKTLPKPAVMLDAAMTNLPRSIRERGDWIARMKKAAWVPSLEFRYGLGEGNFRQYRVLDRQSTATSVETTRESSSSGSTHTDISPVPGSSTESGSEKRSSTTRGTTTSSEGRDSYAVSDKAHWLDEYGVYLTWDLSRIVFREEELGVLDAELSKESFRDSMRTQVITTFYDLKETLMLLENENFKDSIQTQVKKERLAFLLDTLTGGELTNRGQPKNK